MGFKRENDSPPHLSPNLHFNLQIEIPKHKSRSEMGLLNTLQDCDMHLFNLRTQSDPEHPTLPGKTALMTLHRQGRKCGLADHCAGSEAAKSHNVAPR